ncbi:hypothetical protein HCH_03149 [Hahella chejuensis KCTC 2396]|uniref:Uncharacterized protein n=1 Tax=Hahella chejuensis (strain KCTC 2396) TaxID=349521 RepID=Q2SHG2_HAHCH|nr:hypothetical protein HCH_03149 [Hahella chejuensis KCTC 2396]
MQALSLQTNRRKLFVCLINKLLGICAFSAA